MALKPQQIDDILNEIDRQSSIIEVSAQRAVRIARRIHDLKVNLTQPNGHVYTQLVTTRNISSRGLAFVCRNYVHVGTRITFALPTLDNGALVQVAGEVVRCRHAMGVMHEVAVIFDNPIDLPNFVLLTPEDEQKCWNEKGFGNSKTTGDMKEVGSALVVDDAASQRAIAEVWLKRIGFNVTTAGTGAEALSLAGSEVFDLIVLDMMLGEESGLDVARNLRASKYLGLIVAATAEDNPDLRYKAMSSGCDSFVSKPLTARNINMAIESVYGENGMLGESKPITSSMRHDEAIRPLINDFVENVPVMIDQIASALVEEQVEDLATICRSLKADGGGLGFWKITESAEESLACLHAKGTIEDVQRKVNGLLRVLRRVSVDE